jgi:hypothetical protein
VEASSVGKGYARVEWSGGESGARFESDEGTCVSEGSKWTVLFS